MRVALTTTLEKSLLHFLSREAVSEGVPKNIVLESALKLYRKYKLQQAVTEGLKDRQKEYSAITREFHHAQSKLLRKAA